MPKHLNLFKKSFEETISALKAATDKESVEAIDLSYCNILSENAQIIADELKQFTNLRKLDLVWNRSLGAGATTIAAACTLLEELNLSWCGINPEHAEAVAVALKTIPQLRKLNLSSNRGLEAGAAKIAAACTQLEELNLSWCGIRAEHAEAIAAALKTILQLRKLDLSWNCLRAGAVTIVAACSKLEKLSLYDCGIQEEHLSRLTNILEKRPQLIEYLGASDAHTNTMLIVNERIHNSGVEYFQELCVSLGLGEFIGVDQPANKVFSRGNQLACASRLRYIIDHFDAFEECGFDKTKLESALKQLQNQMKFLPNWFSGNGVCKVIKGSDEMPTPFASLPKDMLLEIGSYLKSTVARVTEATEQPTITIPGAVVAETQCAKSSSSSMSL